MAKKSTTSRKSTAKKTASKKANKSADQKKPLRIMDTTLRDGHQSLLATRFRTEDMIPILEIMNRAGFAAMEVWGGATFDVTTRFLNEDPWERLATVKRYLPDTPLQMLLRGQNLVGYRHYADDVVDAFVEKAAETGIDIFRVFDALNDERNMQKSYEAIKRTGKSIQGTICYSLTERRLGGPIYNLEYYRQKARTLEDMGADSLCLKDMAGILSPYDAYELVAALKDEISIPIQLHTHYTSGMASMSCLKAVEAGVDVVDCALAPLALRTSQPAIEPLLSALSGTDRDPQLDLKLLKKCGDYLEKIGPKYRDYLDTSKMACIDAGVLIHQIPGGMRSNLTSQLREADALDRLEEVFEELPETRKDLGFPPLVTPSSQIVGTQAVMNVLFGRYQQVTEPVKDYLAGLYGRPPGKVNTEVRKQCLKGHKYQKPITKRPADLLGPEMPTAKEAVKDMTDDMGDILIYALYPSTGHKYLKWKHGVETPPKEVKPKTLEEAQKEIELMEKARKGQLVEPPAKEPPPKSQATRSFNVFVDGEYFQVEVDPAGNVKSVQSRQEESAPPQAPAPSAQETKQSKSAPPPPSKSSSAAAGAVTAPMPGIIIEYRVKEGDQVNEEDVLLILEAMKMQNEIKAKTSGTVKKISCKEGDRVGKGDTLLEIE